MKKLILVIIAVMALSGPALAAGWGSSVTRDPHATRVLYQTAVPVSVGGTLAETTLLTFNLPPLRANDAVRVSYLVSYGGATNTKTIKPKLGGTTLFTISRSTSGAVLDAPVFTIFNRGSASSQIYTTSVNTANNSAPFTTSINTATSKAITITGQTTLETGFAATATTGSGTAVTVTKSSHGLNSGEYIKVSGATPAGYNIDPVQITVTDANTFTYPSSATGAVTVQPTIQRYSVIRLDACTIELLPAAN